MFFAVTSGIIDTLFSYFQMLHNLVQQFVHFGLNVRHYFRDMQCTSTLARFNRQTNRKTTKVMFAVLFLFFFLNTEEKSILAKKTIPIIKNSSMKANDLMIIATNIHRKKQAVALFNRKLHV